MNLERVIDDSEHLFIDTNIITRNQELFKELPKEKVRLTGPVIEEVLSRDEEYSEYTTFEEKQELWDLFTGHGSQEYPGRDTHPYLNGILDTRFAILGLNKPISEEESMLATGYRRAVGLLSGLIGFRGPFELPREDNFIDNSYDAILTAFTPKPELSEESLATAQVNRKQKSYVKRKLQNKKVFDAVENSIQDSRRMGLAHEDNEYLHQIYNLTDLHLASLAIQTQGTVLTMDKDIEDSLDYFVHAIIPLSDERKHVRVYNVRTHTDSSYSVPTEFAYDVEKLTTDVLKRANQLGVSVDTIVENSLPGRLEKGIISEGTMTPLAVQHKGFKEKMYRNHALLGASGLALAGTAIGIIAPDLMNDSTSFVQQYTDLLQNKNFLQKMIIGMLSATPAGILAASIRRLYVGATGVIQSRKDQEKYGIPKGTNVFSITNQTYH